MNNYCAREVSLVIVTTEHSGYHLSDKRNRSSHKECFQLLRKFEGSEIACTVCTRLSGLHTRESGSEATCRISYTEMTQKLGTAILREAIMHTVHAPTQGGIGPYHAVEWTFPRSEP